MLKFLADENVAYRVVEALRKEKFNVSSIYEKKLFGISDERILKLAREEKRIIITHDKDFGSLIHQPYQLHGGVILLRLKNQSPQNVIFYLIPFLKGIKIDRIKNRLVVFQEGKIRII
ncbi:MAG: DUF5615 family PIN-like protein [Candidatus Nealsonbacteria bacterium]|nr:DUF5615 family PIN-like protein [Candidatus Nealsonbacteria bacterium]